MDTGLIPCPYCDYECIPGADHCDGCGQPLTQSHLPVPATQVERQLLKDRVSLCRRTSLCVSPTLPVREALHLMVANNVGCILITKLGRVEGIFTSRDALMKIGEKANELGDRPVSEYMTSPVETLKSTAKIAFAVHRMDLGGFRHIPIVDEYDRPTGILSARDILNYLAGQMRSARKA